MVTSHPSATSPSSKLTQSPCSHSPLATEWHLPSLSSCAATPLGFHSQETLGLGSLWSISFAGVVAKWLRCDPVKKESLVIMPAFGVQLEQHFWSGRVHRKFVPTGKILRPVLNECVTPFTCYWSLALLLRDEYGLMLVFKNLNPPAKMIVPIWKALCAFVDSNTLNASVLPQLHDPHKHAELTEAVCTPDCSLNI
ncbi:hypothetical protein GQ55_5G490500 [Panicum hallii var. hallii]|uniref:Phosphatidylinositol N-acetylglucosaminyltransferase subunit H conserved domain-containing protein n=1 Tax=Panicum hallii var. hallii TaxID=1504633 RepID=A0A2T7DRI8_9POAL|nr:hypothetical protein GQ55_5G490500 [Panicum hallii var. hallii]